MSSDSGYVFGAGKPGDLSGLSDPAALGMTPHPEGGWYVEHYRNEQTVDTPRGVRHLASSISFLLRPGDESRWHTVASDEIWFWQGGGRLELRLGGSGDEPAETETSQVLGLGGQLLVPAGVWQTARPLDDEPVIVGCVVSPGFDFEDFRLQ